MGAQEIFDSAQAKYNEVIDTLTKFANIIEQARQKGIKYVFYQSEFPASSVEIICKDINATAVEINPLAEDVVENIRHITTLITE